jgi:methylamine---corrinoid protein Co-methyltransferase
MLLSYLDVLDRAYAGPAISEAEWDLDYVAAATKRLVHKHRIAWQPDRIIPDDAGLADAVFAAGFELALELGMYDRDTGRVMRFDQGELEAGLAAMPQALVMGEGRDARTLYPRRIMDSRPPLVWAGNPGAPHSESQFVPAVLSWAQEPVVDLITCGSLAQVDGHPVRTAEASEVVATRRELLYLRHVLRRAGRPGMGMLAGQSSVSELGDLAVSHPDYLRPCDAHLVPMFNELKTDHRTAVRVANAVEYGMRNALLVCVMVGGMAGGPPGAAVVSAASFILGNLTHRADYYLLHPIHLRQIATTTRSVLWVENIVQQAFARNAPCIFVTDIYPKSGALTRELLYETAANAVAITVTGGHLEGVGAADGLLPNATGLECRLMGEVGHAVVRQGMTLGEANALVLALLARYEHVFDQPGGNPGVSFDQAYDPCRVRPLPAWEALYAEVKADLRNMGLRAL